jgi:hypothetical protein
VPLSKKARRRLGSLSKLKVSLVVTVRDASKVPFSVSRGLTLQR